MTFKPASKLRDALRMAIMPEVEKFILSIPKEEMNEIVSHLQSSAKDGSKFAEQMFDIGDRLTNNRQVTDFDIMSFAWYVKDLREHILNTAALREAINI